MRPDEQQLAERPRVERERDLDRDGLVASRRPAAASRPPGPSDAGCAGSRDDALARAASQPADVGVPARAGARRAGCAPRRGVAGSTLAAVSRWANGLRSLPTPIRPSAHAWSGRRAAAGERVEDDVAGPRVAGDERVGEGRREAREVRAHRVEAVAPQPLLVLPLGRECQRRELERELEGELAGRQTSRGSQCGCGNRRRNRRRTGHDAFGTSCPNAGPGRRRGARSVARWKCRPGAVRTAELQPLGGSPGRGARGRLESDSRLSAELLDSPSLTKTDSCRLREARSRQEGPSPPTRLSPAKRSPESSRPAGSGTFGTTAGLSFASVGIRTTRFPSRSRSARRPDHHPESGAFALRGSVMADRVRPASQNVCGTTRQRSP